RLVALCHNEAATLDEEPVLATGHDAGFGVVAKSVPFLRRILFPLPVIPKAELRTRTDSARTADDYAKEFAQKMFRRIHAQFPSGRDNRFSQYFEAPQLF